jgi:hypothetical protein
MITVVAHSAPAAQQVSTSVPVNGQAGLGYANTILARAAS